MNAIEIEKKWQNVGAFENGTAGSAADSNVHHGDSKGTKDKGVDREGVKRAFYEKEKAVTGLVRRLQGISRHIDQINKEVKE